MIFLRLRQLKSLLSTYCVPHHSTKYYCNLAQTRIKIRKCGCFFFLMNFHKPTKLLMVETKPKPMCTFPAGRFQYKPCLPPPNSRNCFLKNPIYLPRSHPLGWLPQKPARGWGVQYHTSRPHGKPWVPTLFKTQGEHCLKKSPEHRMEEQEPSCTVEDGWGGGGVRPCSCRAEQQERASET